MAFFGLGKSDNLYFPGCFSRAFLPNKIDNYKRILKKLDIDFKLQKDNLCCGGFLEEGGYEKELRKIARTTFENFKSKEYKKIITNCPLCLNTLSNYKSLVPEWNMEVEFILVTILNKLKEDKTLARNYFAEPICYYDSCYLARYSQITQVPRELLRLFGYNLIELKYNKEETLCCGSCGGLMETRPELSEKIALEFIKFIKRKKIKKITTADPRAYEQLRKIFEKHQIKKEEIELLEFSDLICNSMNIKTE